MQAGLTSRQADKQAELGVRGTTRLGRMLPGLAIAAMGGVMLVLAQGQPAWLGDDFGPGLMARLLALAVIGLGTVWALVRALASGPSDAPAAAASCGDGDCASGQRWGGPALLAAVLVFGLTVPVAGLVVAAGLAAGLAAWGAGERNPRAWAVTVLGLMALVALVGETLLPPTAPLWPSV